MPRREDERWAAIREDRLQDEIRQAGGRPFCPHCSSRKVYYNRHFRSWRCGSCEKSFRRPRYRLNGDSGEFEQEESGGTLLEEFLSIINRFVMSLRKAIGK